MLKCPVIRINNNFNQKRGSLIEVHIADIHFGVIDPKVQYTILLEQFINKINRQCCPLTFLKFVVWK